MRVIFLFGVTEFDLVAINASGDLKDLAHLFKYDSIYRQFKGTIEVYDKGFIILLILIVLGVTDKVISPLISFIYSLIVNNIIF